MKVLNWVRGVTQRAISHQCSRWTTGWLRAIGALLALMLIGTSHAQVIAEFSIPTGGSTPFGITAGPDGNLWFTEANGNKIGRITPAGVITEYALAGGSTPFGITAGPDGNLWFTEYGGNKIGSITPAGVITEYALAGGTPYSITAGPDGNLWFTEDGGNKIGRITPAGVITEYAIPTGGSIPYGITAGPDGNLWFEEYGGNKIGSITPPPAPPPPTPVPTLSEWAMITFAMLIAGFGIYQQRRRQL